MQNTRIQVLSRSTFFLFQRLQENLIPRLFKFLVAADIYCFFHMLCLDLNLDCEQAIHFLHLCSFSPVLFTYFHCRWSFWFLSHFMFVCIPDLCSHRLWWPWQMWSSFSYNPAQYLKFTVNHDFPSSSSLLRHEDLGILTTKDLSYIRMGFRHQKDSSTIIVIPFWGYFIMDFKTKCKINYKWNTY